MKILVIGMYKKINVHLLSRVIRVWKKKSRASCPHSKAIVLQKKLQINYFVFL